MEMVDQIPGAHELIQWFGCWPSFHDAEILELELRRSRASTIRIHTFRVTNEVDSSARYVTDKHVVVSFILERVTGMDLCGFNEQNVIAGFGLRRTDEGYELLLHPCYGLEGTITATSVRVQFEAGIPPDSQYGRASR